MFAYLALISDVPARTGQEGPDWNRYVLMCVLLLLVLGVLAWGMRTLVAGSARAGAARRSLQVLDVLSLGGKQRVCVVRCYDRTFALGVGEKEVGLIAEIDATVSATARDESGATPRAAFGAILARLSGRAQASTESPS